jgi:hypothetical protein
VSNLDFDYPLLYHNESDVLLKRIRGETAVFYMLSSHGCTRQSRVSTTLITAFRTGHPHDSSIPRPRTLAARLNLQSAISE